METQTEKQETRKGRGDRVALYHPSTDGNGAAAQLEPKIGRNSGNGGSCFFLDMAQQKTTASRNGDGFVPATFDWENKITVKLGFHDICHFLAVLEGKVDHVGGRRDGLFHQNGQTTTVIRLKQAEDGGYLLGLSRKRPDDEEARRISTSLTEIEAIGLRHVLAVSLFFMALPVESGHGV
ncbi:MAG: hypothetical protein HQ559_03665 [Lentisphaerae bacterium]|nr:hypothetical protein [Lentisphaerota bacterium]